MIAGGYSRSAVKQYCGGARLALSLLDKPHTQLDSTTDLDRVRDYLAHRGLKPATLDTYRKGLVKLAQYLRYRRNQPQPERPINWDRYLSPFSANLAGKIRGYIAHHSRSWRTEQQRQATLNLLSHLTFTLRELDCHADLSAISPTTWFDYVDRRQQQNNTQPATLNRELYDLRDFLRFLVDSAYSVETRILTLDPLDSGDPLPRDVPVGQLRKLLQQIATETGETNHQTLLDRAWALLMLHSGLRSSEVRHLRLANLDLEKRQVRIEQGKGLQDRIVFLSEEGVEALQAYLAVRGPAATSHLFIYRHQPLSVGYCGNRLHIYGQRCELRVTPHQLRYSCATLLLNAGTPILTVQRILGHQYAETTLRYARLYDRTVANDYARAMGKVEGRNRG